MNKGFLSHETFRPYADLDGKAAADFLKAHGYINIRHADLGTNGLAVGIAPNGDVAALSTNGHFSPSVTAADLPSAARAGLL